MNKKLIYTGIWLCLGGLALGQAAWAKPGNDNANKQSMKKCPQSVIQSATLVLTKKQPNARFDDNGTLDDITDDSYETCNKDFSECVVVVGPSDLGVPRQIIIGSNGANNIEGTPGNDIICGMNGNDVIDGLAGNDEIHGNNGKDRLYGDLGDDTLYGGNGNDFVSGYLDDNDKNYTDDEVLTNPEDSDKDHLYGGNGNDRLLGGPDSDDLNGENGKDDLDGGDGVDGVHGGKSKDSCSDDDGLADDDCGETELEDEHGAGHS